MEGNISELVEERRSKCRRHVDVEQMNIRDLDRRDSPGCYYVTKYFLIVLFGVYFIIIPGFCIYVGIAYSYCEDMFATWLIVGGILGYLDLSVYLFRRLLKRSFDEYRDDCKNNDCLLGMINVVSAILLVWWVWGFGRIFSGSMNEDPVMEDPVCKEYLYRFPFWLTITPFPMLFIGLFGGICVTALE